MDLELHHAAGALAQRSLRGRPRRLGAAGGGGLTGSALRRFLIVTADDFGLHPSVNDAVERSNRAGILTSASLMVAAPAAADALRRTRDLPGLNVGLHLVLADGRALLDPRCIPGVADADGHMDADMLGRGIRYFFVPRIRRQLEAEIRAQFAAFARTGLICDHVNVHKHFHLHPTLFGMVLDIGRDYGSPPMRVPHEPGWFAGRYAGMTAAAGAALLSPFILGMKRRLRQAGIFHNDRIFGIAASGAMDESKLLAILARLPGGVTEIYLHPASAAPFSTSMPDYRHADELAALLSDRVRDAVAASGAQVGGFRAAAASGCIHR